MSAFNESFRFGIRNIRKRPYRSFCLMLAAVIGSYALFVGLALKASLNNGIGRMQERMGADLMIVPESSEIEARNILLTGEPEFFYMDVAVATAAAEIEGVESFAQKLLEMKEEKYVEAKEDLIGLFFTIFINVQNASGDVRNFKLAMSLVILLQFPVCWILLKMGCTPITVYLVTIACQIINIFVTHHFTMQKMTYTYRELVREIYFPEAKVIVCSTVLPLLCVLFLPYGWWRFLLTGTLCVACTVPSVLYLGCSASERVYIYDAIGNFLRKKGLLKR